MQGLVYELEIAPKAKESRETSTNAMVQNFVDMAEEEKKPQEEETVAAEEESPSPHLVIKEEQ